MRKSHNVNILLRELRAHYSQCNDVGLARLAAQGCIDAKNKMAYAYSLLAVGLALDYAFKNRYDPDECISVALLGLAEGINAYPINSEIPPVAVYKMYIRSAFSQHINELNPHWSYELSCALRHAFKDGYTLENLEGFVKLRYEFLQAEVKSLDAPLADDYDVTIGDSIPDEVTFDISEDCKDFVRKLLPSLKPKEQLVLKLFFGLDDGFPRSIEVIASELDLTPEGVRRIKIRALDKLSALIKPGSSLKFELDALLSTSDI